MIPGHNGQINFSLYFAASEDTSKQNIRMRECPLANSEVKRIFFSNKAKQSFLYGSSSSSKPLAKVFKDGFNINVNGVADHVEITRIFVILDYDGDWQSIAELYPSSPQTQNDQMEVEGVVAAASPSSTEESVKIENKSSYVWLKNTFDEEKEENGSTELKFILKALGDDGNIYDVRLPMDFRVTFSLRCEYVMTLVTHIKNDVKDD